MIHMSIFILASRYNHQLIEKYKQTIQREVMITDSDRDWKDPEGLERRRWHKELTAYHKLRTITIKGKNWWLGDNRH